MGRSPCCDKIGLKKGPWTPEEDQKLLAYIEEHGHGSWRALPAKAGLQRCGKSCRLRWSNYLRPDIKRGKFSLQEEQTIIQLHALLGNRWSAIATHLPKRTDNEIKNYWNTHLKKRLTRLGIDPVTHKPKNDALLSCDGQSKNAANLSHMAQWESARLEAEARLVRQSKLRSSSLQHQLSSSPINKPFPPPRPPRCLDILKAWNGSGSSKSGGGIPFAGLAGDLESPTSTLSYSENGPPIPTIGIGENASPFIELVGNSSAGSCDHQGGIMIEENDEKWKRLGGSNTLPEYKEGIENSISFTSGIRDITMSMESAWTPESLRSTNEHVAGASFVETFTELLLSSSGGRSFPEGGGESYNGTDSGGSNGSGSGSDYYEDNKNYWNNILKLVNASPADSPLFSSFYNSSKLGQSS